jgi:hypothetical protein
VVDRATEIPDCALTLDLLGDQPTPPQTVICEICVICGSYLLFLRVLCALVVKSALSELCVSVVK